MVTHVLSVILHHTIASSSSMTAAIVCRNYTLECDVPAWMSYAATLRLTLATVAAENHCEEQFCFTDKWGRELKRSPKLGQWEEQGGEEGHGEPELRPEQLPLSVHLLLLHQLGHLEVVRLQTSHSEHNQVFWRGNRKSTGGWGTFSGGAGGP